MVTFEEPGAHPCGPLVIADDNEDDVFLLRRKLHRIGVHTPIITVRDGFEAIEFLKQLCDQRERLPALLLLDLKMPRATGFSVLCWLREQDVFDAMKVVILSDSEDPGDIALAAELEADAYLAKHPDAGALTELLRRFAPAVLTTQPVAASSAA